MPRIFLFSRLPFATHVSRPTFRNAHSRPTFREPHFAPPIRDPCFTTNVSRLYSRLMFATNVRLYSRLTFTTRIRDSTRDSRLRLLITPPTATRSFLLQLPSCVPTTDGRTVLTPQRHLPSVPTLTLTKNIFGTFSLAWPLPLATTYHHVHYMALCLLTHPLAHYLLKRPLPPARTPSNIPTFITPSAPPSIPPVWEHVIDVLMKPPTTTAEGHNMRSWVTYPSLHLWKTS